MKIHLLFTDFPGPGNECIFVEAEDGKGHSVNVGEWKKRPDNYVELVIDTGPRINELLEANGRLHNELTSRGNEIRRLNAIIARMEPFTSLVIAEPPDTKHKSLDWPGPRAAEPPTCAHDFTLDVRERIATCTKCGAVAPAWGKGQIK